MAAMQLGPELATSAQRRAAFQRALVDSVDAVRRAAEILGFMEDAGDDLSGISSNTVRLMRRIRDQKMLPEVFVQIGGRLRARVAQLPIRTQREILEGHPVPLVVKSATGMETMSVDARKLQPAQIMQVFGEGFIRDESEQRLFIEAMNKHVPPPDEELKQVTVLLKQQGIRVNGVFLSRDELWRYIKALEKQ